MNNQRFEQRMAVRPLRNNEVWYRARLRNVAKTARASVEPELRKFIKEAIKPENQQMAHHLALTARNLIRNAAQRHMTSTDVTGISSQAPRIAARAASLNLDAVDRQFQKHLKQATGISAQFGKPDISHGKIVSTVHVGTGDTKSTVAPSDLLSVDWQRREYDREQYEAWLNYARDFDPDQPRDETGKWTSGGTSGYTGGGLSSERQRVNPNDPRERQRAQAELAQSRGAAEAGAGGLPYTYTRRSGRDVEGVRVLGVPVRESWSLDPKVADALKAKGYASPDVHELDYNDPRAAQVFHDQIAQTKVGNRFAASVHVYSPEEYGQMRMFLSKDGKAGMALKPDGDMVSAFVHGDGPKGAIHTMLEVQKQAGGTKLDCFDTVLPAIYAPHGFTAVARTSWNDEYKPEGWDKNTYAKFNKGEPDVVFMARTSSAAPYRAGDGVRVDYDKAVSIQQAAVNQFTKRGGAMSDWLTVDWKRVSEEQIERERIWKSVRDFDPDQPRDETGKWTSGGASGAAPSGAGHSAEARAQDAISQAVNHANNGVSDKATYDALREQAYRPELEPEALRGTSHEKGREGQDGKTTQEANQVNGKYTAKRQELHDKIVNDVLGPKPAVAETHPVVVFQGGGAASGKTEAVGVELQKKYPGIAVSDPDIVKFGSKGKGGLPEAEILKKSDPLGAAARLHEESSDISKQIQKEALARGQSLIIDGVGGNPSKIEKQIADFRNAGYRVEVHYADRDTNHALAQMATRYQKTGRWVPPDVLVDGHQKAAYAYHQVASQSDEASLRFSKERTAALSETKYELVHRSGNGAHQYSEVVNTSLYEQHRRKGGY